MRGRRPAGPEYVDQLTGSEQAKERLKVVLETVAGRCRIQEACRRLGISEPRFHQLRQQVLEAALERLEPQPAGRKPTPRSPEQIRLDALADELAAKDVELRAAQARAEIALTLPRVAEKPATPEKKTTQTTAGSRRRTRGKKKRS
jgi:helix-turn-helix protein